MKIVFHHKKITGLLSVLPERCIKFEDEVDNYTFAAKQTLRLQKVMGYKQHRIVKDTTATSDLCLAGMRYILDKGWLKKEEIGGIIIARAYPDYMIPPVSSIVQGELGLADDVFVLDISQGCAGFVMALVEGFMLLEHLQNRKVVVISADVLSKRASKQDRNSWPLAGDAAGIAVIENCEGDNSIFIEVCNDGKQRNALRISAGGSRMPSTVETAKMFDEANDGNLRSLDNLTMRGTDVFTFMMSKVPPMIDDLLKYADVSKEDIKAFILHQPNKFMLRKLAEKIGVPYEKVPMNVVEEFGNSSGACVPVCATYNLAEPLKNEQHKYCMAAFGSGLTYAGMVLDMGKLDFCEMMVSEL
ncbi:MAG: ketoacyl-ACP synthase III [Phascolarctobacterium sp.]|nr:ketoacyl-ACP synthase III [Candidatus Phascolarctobacterium caballi]